MRSTLEYGCTIWDPYCQGDIDQLEKIQRRAARFITGDYRSRTPGCVTSMLSKLELPTLQERRQQLRLTLFHKVVEERIPALPPEKFLTPARANKRQIRAKQYTGFITSNLVTKHQTLNTRPFQTIQTNTNEFKNSFFVKTIVDWNQLPEDAVKAQTTEAFIQHLRRLSAP